jgi:hypothetical protein
MDSGRQRHEPLVTGSSGEPIPAYWPETLTKAVAAPGAYRCFIEGFGELNFEGADPTGEGWVTLFDARSVDQADDAPDRFPIGVDVRVDKIVWIAEWSGN